MPLSYRATCIVFMASALAFSGVSCGDKEIQRRPAKKVEKKAAAAAAPVESKEKLEVPSIFQLPKDNYTYNPVGKRDPFQVYAGEAVQGGDDTPRSPLERYALNQLKVTAIVWGLASPRALLLAPDGQSYIVRRNMRLGKHRGRVARISRRQLFVEEEYRDPNGKLVVRESVLEIRPKEIKTREKEKLELKFSEE